MNVPGAIVDPDSFNWHSANLPMGEVILRVKIKKTNYTNSCVTGTPQYNGITIMSNAMIHVFLLSISRSISQISLTVTSSPSDLCNA